MSRFDAELVDNGNVAKRRSELNNHVLTPTKE